MGRVREALQQFCKLGMKAAFLCSRDGLLIDAVTCPNERLDLDRIVAGVAAAMVSSKAASDPMLHTPRSVVMELEGAAMVVRPAGEDVIGAVLATDDAALERIRRELVRLLPELTAAGSGEPLDLMMFISDALGAGQPAQPQPAAGKPPGRHPHEVDVPLQRDGPLREAAEQGSETVAPAHADMLEPGRSASGASAEQSTMMREQRGAPPQELDPTWPPRERLILEGVGLNITGQVATVVVDLSYGTRKQTEKVVARDSKEGRRVLIAEAAARAVTAFLPNGYGVVLKSINATPPDGDALLAKIVFLTPSGEETLMGVAPLDDELRAAAKAVLSALNRRISRLL